LVLDLTLLPTACRRAGDRIDEIVAAYLQKTAIVEPTLADEEPPPRSVGLSTASIRKSNDAASNSTLLPENLTHLHQIVESKII
jgi:hypothetical protein